MRIQIISDLHLEFHPDGGRDFLSSMDFKGSDALVVAGDLCDARTLAPSFELLCSACSIPILYVPGNHEYYGSSFSEVAAFFGTVGQTYPNLHVLNNKTVTLAGQRFVGTTLWFPDRPENYRFERMLNDFRMIKEFGENVYAANSKARKFLEDELRRGDIVVTHHLPSLRSVPAHFKNSPSNRFFVCQLDELILERQPALWVHGHTHDSVDYRLRNTRVVCNPFGYLGHELNNRWNAEKNIEINVSGRLSQP